MAQRGIVFLVSLALVSGSWAESPSLYEKAEEQNKHIQAVEDHLNHLINRVNAMGTNSKAFNDYLDQDIQRRTDQSSTQESLTNNEMPPLVLPPLELTCEEKAAIEESVLGPPDAIPEWDDLDYYFVGSVGIVAAIYDTLFTKHLTRVVQRIRLPINIQKALEKFSRTPSDMGPGGGDHRGYSPAHDPLLGIVFGIYDLMTGNSTVFKDGEIIISPNPRFTQSNLPEALIRWIAHLASDICTAKGLPIPGWTLLQSLNVGSIGPKGRTVAQIAHEMYRRGYDLRRFAVDATTPAMIEVLIRTYHHMSILDNAEGASETDRCLQEERNNAKLDSMLFWAHQIAVAANAGKIAFFMAQPPPIINIKALMSINLPQWIMYMKSTINYAKAKSRNIEIEHIRRNRKELTYLWTEMEVVFYSNNQKGPSNDN